MIPVARIVFALFAALLIVGGIAGFLEKHSVISLIAGVVCGGLCAYGAYLMATQPRTALIVGLVGAILAAGGMGNRVKDKTTGELHIWPAAIVLGCGVLTAIVAAAGLATMNGNGSAPGAGR